MQTHMFDLFVEGDSFDLFHMPFWWRSEEAFGSIYVPSRSIDCAVNSAKLTLTKRIVKDVAAFFPDPKGIEGGQLWRGFVSCSLAYLLSLLLTYLSTELGEMFKILFELDYLGHIRMLRLIEP